MHAIVPLIDEHLRRFPKLIRAYSSKVTQAF
jgi:hypothetical protein